MTKIAWEIWEDQVIKGIKRLEKSICKLKELLVYIRSRDVNSIEKYQHENNLRNHEEKIYG